MLRLIPLGFAVLALTGCAIFTKHITVSVDGYAAPTAPAPGKYYLASGTPRVSEGDLQFQSFAASLESALASRGWTRVKDRKDAATLIRFRYAVSDPVSSVREYETPEFGTTGYRVDRVQTTSATGAVTQRTVMTPSYGQTGVSRRMDARVIYGLSVIVEAYDLTAKDAEGAPPQVWKTLVGATDDTGNLRAHLPRMIATAAPQFGKDTHGVIDTEIPAEESK